jgi:hypothetical protein
MHTLTPEKELLTPENGLWEKISLKKQPFSPFVHLFW